jgi:uncharacterized membrane protein YccC
MPSAFAVGSELIGNADVATFAAFGSFAMLLLVDFTGPMNTRLQAYAALAVTCGVLICLGTLASRDPWLAAAVMAVVGFAVLFSGVVSSVLASATPGLLLAMILPVSLAGPSSAIPDRLAGWGIASAAALLAVWLLWPAPAREPLRLPAANALRAVADRLDADVAYLLAADDAPSGELHAEAAARADESVNSLRQSFLTAPYRPTGLSTSARTLVRLVDELQWLAQIVRYARPRSTPRRTVNPAVVEVKRASAVVLRAAAELLRDPAAERRTLDLALDELRSSVAAMEDQVTASLPQRPRLRNGADGARADTGDVVTALDPTFRAQELGFAVAQIAGNVALTAAADRRSWLDRVLGRQPVGVRGPLAAAAERGAAHLEWDSVWLQNSIRGAVGLGLAVFIARESGVQHAFWVVLGTLSVLRTNALNTGQSVIRGLLGTAAGFVVGSVLLLLIGTNTTVLWALLPLAVFVAGYLPAVASFAAGQAAFTVLIVIVFNIIAPAGWQVGLLRIEDVAIGCAVSLLVGLLFWPRGAGAALGRTVATAYSESVRYLAAAVAYGMVRCDPRLRASVEAPTESAMRAAAASRRLDDAYRNYLAERGAKPASLADVTGLVNGVVGLRLVGDAVLDLWRRDDSDVVGDREAARREIVATAERVVSWYDLMSARLLSSSEPPSPLSDDALSDGKLVDALRRDLLEADARAAGTAARMIWTGDYLDAVRRLQEALVGPARDASQHRALAEPAGLLAGLR